MKQHYFELCCEARYMKNVLGLTFKEIGYIQGVHETGIHYRIRKIEGVPVNEINENGINRVIERYKQHMELRKDRYAA